MNSDYATAEAGPDEVLLIGDASAAFCDSEHLSRLPVRRCADILSGIEAAAAGRFAAVAVVMAGAAANLGSALGALRKATGARIVLLARMFEEPRAMELVASAGNGASLADDYLVCPLRMDGFCRAVRGAAAQAAVRPAATATSSAIADRIARLEKLATEDELTGLKNRRYIWEFARQIIERAKNDNGRVTALIFDIDDLKHYNDVYGHTAGDEVLRQAAVMMRRCCRKHDVVARIGGDEFAVVFWDDPRCRLAAAPNERRTSTAEHPKEVLAIARRFRKEVEIAELPLLGSEAKGVLTISGGLASLDRDGSTAEELFAKADQGLLEAKRSGKNRIYLVGQPENDIDKLV